MNYFFIRLLFDSFKPLDVKLKKWKNTKESNFGAMK